MKILVQNVINSKLNLKDGDEKNKLINEHELNLKGRGSLSVYET